MPLSLQAAPAAEPLDAAACRAQLRWTSTAEDAYFTGTLIPAARERAEQATRRQLITATWDWHLRRFPSCDLIELPKPPLQGVTHVKYYDETGTLQTLSAALYDVLAPAGPQCARGQIRLAYGESWPSTQDVQSAVQIRFVAGYGAAGTAVPPRIKMAMLQDIGGLWEFRENLIAGAPPGEIPGGSAAVYRSFRSWARLPLEDGID